MASPAISKTPESNWKRILLKWFFAGVGLAFGLVAATGVLLWYSSRHTPQKPWNTTALLAKEPPGFRVTDDGKRIRFLYSVGNTTDKDYELETYSQWKFVVRLSDGALTSPLREDLQLELSVFIPAREKGGINFSLAFSDIPARGTAETDEAYHERLRGYLQQRSAVAGFVLFDDSNRYQINFPRWLAGSPERKQALTASPTGINAATGATKAYLGFTYKFDGKRWVKGSQALNFMPSGKEEPWSDDQYDPLGLLSKEQRAKRLLTEQQIQQVANQFGVSYEEAWKDAKAQGYQVPPTH